MFPYGGGGGGRFPSSGTDRTGFAFNSSAPSSNDFGFDLLNDQNDSRYEFPPLADFPLESKDEVLGILKKRPHSPDADKIATLKKSTIDNNAALSIASAANKIGSGGLKTEGLDTEESFVERWTCDVCKSVSFGTLEEARAHESKCKQLKQDAPMQSNEMMAAGALTSFAVRAISSSTTSATTSTATETGSDDGAAVASDGSTQEAAASFGSRDPSLVINLVPSISDTSTLSDYNNLLVRNIEFFYPSKSHVNYENLSGSKNTSNMSDIRLGLRCIHCKDSPTHITAAAFFPSTIGSIASGLGTIGSRHFGLGKCPSAHPDLVHQMVETKKSSSIQTRSNGRIGLDAYCKNIAQQYDIFDDEVSGICWVDNKLHPSIELDRSSIASVLAGMKHDTNIEMRPFVPSEMRCFWECVRCRSLEVPFRARGSVVFSVDEPTPEMIQDHLKICNGSKPLLVPRNAIIEPFYGNYENAPLPPIRIKWESNKTSTTKEKSKRASDDIRSGVDADPLCFDADRPYTTDFAFFTVSQLKRCFLTKTGGSRGACPIGYAGLACTHCAGDANERRFFYSTANQMRNSFSHIPSHLAVCEKCPAEVKTRLEELKEVRNRQKSLLKPGYHKIFIDRVWDRMHNGPSAAVTIPAESSDNNTKRDNNNQMSTVSSAAVSPRDELSALMKTSPSSLVKDDDRSLTTDLTFFTLLQVEAYSMLGAGSLDENSREIGFPGLVCTHCKVRKFFTTSGEHLSGLLVTISNHMQTCQSCPKLVRNQITQFRGTHDSQLRRITSESHDACMENVWTRLVKASRKEKRKSRVQKPVEIEENVLYLPLDQSKPLVTSEDEHLVTEFTYFTMQQVRPCNLDRSENGSRSQFADGFPGLECIHCADTLQSRKFFYRTLEILAGNYAHIPNHIAGCSRCPPDVKIALASKKEEHLRIKHKLDRGSQRQFFQRIWDRLHACKQVQN